ncbi:MAG: sigma factor [Ginsengibacter sp.]
MQDTDFISKDDLQMTDFIGQRNQQSMDYFYDKYSPALYGAIYRIIDNRHLAEECLMATFVKAWNEMAAFRSTGSSFFTWLLKMARQFAFEAICREKEENPAAHNFVHGAKQPVSAFEMVYSKGFSVTQAAELSAISVTELKTNLRRDLQNMKNKTEKS